MMGRSIKGLGRVQSGQSEGEVLDWTVRSEWLDGGTDGKRRGRGVCLLLCPDGLHNCSVPLRISSGIAVNGLHLRQMSEVFACCCNLQWYVVRDGWVDGW
uniref:Uncharacterized protein n=1 Tax=Setaria digitata TaxID=48799 RepID=A0A915PIT7_9BILA